MEMQILYTIALLVLLYGATRFAMKTNGGYGLFIPSIMVIVSGWFLFQEKLPEINERIIVLGVLFFFMAGFRFLYQNRDQKSTN